MVIAIEDGRLEHDPPSAAPVDFRLSIDPVTYRLLVNLAYPIALPVVLLLLVVGATFGTQACLGAVNTPDERLSGVWLAPEGDLWRRPGPDATEAWELDASYLLSEDGQRRHREAHARGVEIELERHR